MALAALRNWLTVLVMTLVVSLVLAACTTEDDGEPAVEPAAPAAEDVTTPTLDEPGADDDTETPTPESPTPTSTPEIAENEGYPVTVTRSDGVELTIEERPERIVSLSPGATETFFAVGAGDQLAAVDRFSDHPPEATELPQVDAYEPDPEAIVEMEPDLVFVIFDTEGIVDILEDVDIPVLYLEAPQSIGELLDQVRLFGEVTGNAAQADELADSLAERAETIEDQLADIEAGPRVYHELDESFFTVGPNSFVGDLYTILKAQNIAEGAVGEYPQLSEEVILEQDPEVIILPVGPEDDGARAVNLRERPGWDDIDAVQNDRIYEIDRDIVSRPGPRIVDALEQLAELLYPDEFAAQSGPVIGPGEYQLAA